MKILVGTEGSKASLKAVKQAIRMARQTGEGSSITLVCVHDETAFFHAERFVGRQAVSDYLRELSDKQILPAHRLIEKAGMRHDIVIRTGHVAREIVQVAESGKFDVVLVGSKGRSAFEDILMGSVARRVAETCKIPVMIVK